MSSGCTVCPLCLGILQYGMCVCASLFLLRETFNVPVRALLSLSLDREGHVTPYVVCYACGCVCVGGSSWWLQSFSRHPAAPGSRSITQLASFLSLFKCISLNVDGFCLNECVTWLFKMLFILSHMLRVAFAAFKAVAQSTGWQGRCISIHCLSIHLCTFPCLTNVRGRHLADI